MAPKLNAGDQFPELTLRLSEGTTLRLPRGMGTKYTIALFYRGHW